MPGRPRFMAKRVYKLLVEYRALGEQLLGLVPDVYRKDQSPRNSIGIAWRNVADANVEAYYALDELSMLLDAKAGIQRQDPVAAEPQREFKLTDVVEVDGETGTIADWCIQFEIDPNIVLQRIADGWDTEEAMVVPAAAEPSVTPVESNE